MDNLPHILVVDDHRQIRDSVTRFLERNGMRATAAKDAREMDEKLAKGHYDLMVLDVMMPGEDGLSVCKRISAEKRLPIIMLTALGQDSDRIVGLEIGADDYLPKPFNPRELLARIKAVLRRAAYETSEAGTISGRILRFGGLTLDTDAHVIMDGDGTRVQLTTADFRLLTVLLARPRMVLSREQLLDLTAGRAAGPLDRTIDNQISRLRRKIEADPLHPALITTVRSHGYSLNADVEVIA
ncbi:response regulator [Ruegeria marina]|uniref:Regulatory protein VirG n=1 Tax=Ruegeria marina TaxID=639004 RepID=A0A1G6I6N2_9RHOB|nr:response regulator [Ruegeria marina]SDC01416.1 two-component system, OmpR family, response regulator [Ruegeria marina]